MFQELQRTCTATVLLINSFVRWRSRYRCRRSFVRCTCEKREKLPIDFETTVVIRYIWFYRNFLNKVTIFVSIYKKKSQVFLVTHSRDDFFHRPACGLYLIYRFCRCFGVYLTFCPHVSIHLRMQMFSWEYIGPISGKQSVNSNSRVNIWKPNDYVDARHVEMSEKMFFFVEKMFICLDCICSHVMCVNYVGPRFSSCNNKTVLSKRVRRRKLVTSFHFKENLS